MLPGSCIGVFPESYNLVHAFHFSPLERQNQENLCEVQVNLVSIANPRPALAA